MAEKETVKKAAVEVNNDAEAILKKAKGFWDRFSKPIIYGGSAIILLVGGYLAYKKFYKLPQETKAKDEIFAAQRLLMAMTTNGSFPKDSVKILLDGGTLDGQKVTGVLKVISKYGGTPAGNFARYMAGVAYLQDREFDKAIKYLKDFDGKGDDNYQAATYNMLGQAYAEKNNKEEAFSYFKKAASVNEKDENITPRELLNAANYAEHIGKSKEAIELLKKIKDNFGNSQPATSGEVDKLLAKLGVTE